jgi:hypothetical protein
MTLKLVLAFRMCLQIISSRATLSKDFETEFDTFLSQKVVLMLKTKHFPRQKKNKTNGKLLFTIDPEK